MVIPFKHVIIIIIIIITIIIIIVIIITIIIIIIKHALFQSLSQSWQAITGTKSDLTRSHL